MTTAEATFLQSLARRIANTYLEHTRPAAILLTGSAATGDADHYSDLDLILYYEQLPSDEALDAARAAVAPDDHHVLAPRTETGYIENLFLHGVQCQIGHLTFRDVEQDVARLVVDLDLAPEMFKVAGGLIDGLALHGEDLIERWRASARYTDALQRAVVEKHWRFFPLWYFDDHVAARDATLWRYQILVEAAYNLVAVLAAVNRVYFSTFEFKRPRRLLNRFELAPHDLADRLEALFELERAVAAAELERLVGETREIVAAALPDLELPLKRPLGQREVPWRLEDGAR
jgi:hypothetical protein